MAIEENMDMMHEGDLDKKWMGLWEEHVAWTRLTIISLVDIKDPTETIATENRLLRNTKDMAEVCIMFDIYKSVILIQKKVLEIKFRFKICPCPYLQIKLLLPHLWHR